MSGGAQPLPIEKNLEMQNLAQDPFLVTNCRKEILLKFDQKVYLILSVKVV